MLADDHPAFLQGVAHHFSNRKDCEIVIQVTDGASCLEQIRRTEPDWAIIDLAMPHLTGFEVLEKLLSSSVSTRIVVLSMHADTSYAEKAQRLGACAFIAKEDALSELDQAMLTPLGQFYASGFVGNPTHHLLDRPHAAMLEQLTDQEKRILLLLGDGRTSKEIAKQLEISPRTVQAHRRNMAEKLDLQGPNRLLQFAIEQAQTKSP